MYGMAMGTIEEHKEDDMDVTIMVDTPDGIEAEKAMEKRKSIR